MSTATPPSGSKATSTAPPSSWRPGSREGKLFAGFWRVAPACARCGLDNGFADAGDGPAIFVILFAGFIVAAAALITEFKYAPPLWVHALLWGPLAVIVCVGPLRP